MSRTLIGKDITISGITDSESDPAVLTRYDSHYGAAWGMAAVQYPAKYVQDISSILGVQVRISIEDETLLIGRVVKCPSRLDAGAETVQLQIADIRWDMARRRVGEHGVGELSETYGGFAGVGLHVCFNAGGRGNRSALPNEEGVYTFSTAPDAARWTRAQMLVFILAWYYPDMAVEEESLTGPWEEEEDNVQLYNQTIPAALSELSARAGESWAPAYEGENILYARLMATPTTAATFNLPATTGSATTASADENSVVDLDIENSILDSIDVLQVHTNNVWIEHTYENFGDAPLLVEESEDIRTHGYGRQFTVDVTQYEAHLLGAKLPAGSRPKRWVRQNGTRILESGDGYLAANDPRLLIQYGTAAMPEYCCWVNIDGTEVYERIQSGLLVIPDEARILLANTCSLIKADGSTYDVDCGIIERIRITVTTELEVPYVSYTSPTGYHIDADHPVKEIIQRSDIQPIQRYKSYLPDLTSANPNATQLLDPTEAAWYFDPRTWADAVHNAYLPTRNRQEVTLRIRLLHMPVIALGAKVEITPAEVGLTGTEMVIGVSYDAANGQHVTVTATNNLARLIAGDL